MSYVYFFWIFHKTLNMSILWRNMIFLNYMKKLMKASELCFVGGSVDSTVRFDPTWSNIYINNCGVFVATPFTQGFPIFRFIIRYRISCLNLQRYHQWRMFLRFLQIEGNIVSYKKIKEFLQIDVSKFDELDTLVALGQLGTKNFISIAFHHYTFILQRCKNMPKRYRKP